MPAPAKPLHDRPARRPDLLVALILLVALVRGLAPVGWMPAFGPDGARLVICTAAGLVEAPSELAPAGDADAPSPVAESAPCAFAAPGALLLPALALLPFRHARLAGHPPTGPPAETAGPLRHLRPPAQAPPFLH